MIVVTGATGQLGSLIVQRLLERVPADQIGVSVRDPDRAADLAGRGVRVRRGDFTDPDTLTAAFQGASQVLIVSVDKLGDQAIAQHKTAIDAANRAGAQRILYTSHQAASPDSLFTPARDHAATEAHLAVTARAFTALRNGFHAATMAHLLGRALDTGDLVAPADGPVSWTTHADLAEAAAVILADGNRSAGETPVLTAADAVDLRGVARILSDLTGHTIRRVIVDDDDYVTGLVRRGVPELAAHMFLSQFRAARHGEFSVSDPALQTLLGHEPQPIRTVLEGVITARRGRHWRVSPTPSSPARYWPANSFACSPFIGRPGSSSMVALSPSVRSWAEHWMGGRAERPAPGRSCVPARHSLTARSSNDPNTVPNRKPP